LSSPSKKKKASGQKDEGPKRTTVRVSRPVAAPPSPMVEVRHDGEMMEREASGFSLGEVSQAGMAVGLARSWKVIVDPRRRSVLDGNVSSLKKWFAQAKKETVEQRVEGEVRKIERAVAKEARKVEKEMEKGVGKVEKEVEKVEKEVVEKVEAPVKKRQKKKAEPKPDSD
jgi:ribosomal protein L13E